MNPLFDLFKGRKSRPLSRESDSDDEADEQASVERDEMIRGVEELSETTVKEVMVPRTDTVFLPVDAPADELLSTVVESGHSRIPVYRESIDDVVGILYAKDLLASFVAGGRSEIRAADIMRKPFLVPETKRIDALLREFKRRRVHIAVVIDEYGGVAGIVCMEDIIEEIVGEIQDEFDDEADAIARIGEAEWLCDARTKLDDLNGRLGLDLPAQEFDSLGGYVLDLFGRIPGRLERIEHEGVAFTVQELEGHRVISIRIALVKPSGGSPDETDATRNGGDEGGDPRITPSGAADA